ncbi:MAG: protein kinase [Nitrospirae bacterium]|nr:protein kinase [Nitrospirota bacterium]
MNYFHGLLLKAAAIYHTYLNDHPDFHDFMEDFTRQAQFYWNEIIQNTPNWLKLSLAVLIAGETVLIFVRIFIDSSLVGWVLKILPRAFYRKTIIKRAERFAKNQKYLQAGKLYETVEEYSRAVAMFVKGENYHRPALIYVKLGKYREAARVCEEGKEYREAARYYEKEGLYLKAGEMYRHLKEFLQAAENFEKVVSALENETPSEENTRKIQEISASAGDLFFKAKEYRKAGFFLEKAGLFEQSALAFSKAKKPLLTARSLESGGKFKEAAKLYLAEGERENAALCFEKGGAFFEAGDIFNQMGNTDRAISLYQKITSNSKNYEQASLLLGGLFQKKGMLGPAREKYQRLIERKSVARENLETFYNLALLTEKIGDLHEAVSLYEKILAEDLSYKDVPARLEQLGEKVKQASALTPEETEAHTVTSRYKILNELGRGGMGIVYRAEDTVLKRIVAYKILPDSFKNNPQFLESFMLEARTAAALNHPNIVTIYDTGKVGSDYYITMECVDGMTLKDLLVKTRGGVPIRIVMAIARQLCLGLEYAHDKNVIHRDIKPANLMLTKDKMVKIMDFGLAKLVHEGLSEKTTVKGTPYYMSPEQILGKNVDAQTDLYALGCTLYHLLAGRPPFTEGDIYYHHLHSIPESPKRYNEKIPDALANIILKSLEKDKTARYRHPGELLNALALINENEPVKAV